MTRNHDLELATAIVLMLEAAVGRHTEVELDYRFWTMVLELAFDEVRDLVVEGLPLDSVVVDAFDLGREDDLTS